MPPSRSAGAAQQELAAGAAPLDARLAARAASAPEADGATYALFDDAAIQELKVLSFAVIKNMYRRSLRACPAYCSTDTPADACVCSCPALDADAATGNATFLLAKYLDAKILPSGALQEKFTRLSAVEADGGGGVEVLTRAIRTLCTTTVEVGDQLESASPNDISFWPIHPTLERLYLWKKLNTVFANESWP